MPKTDGFQVCTRLKKEQNSKDIPIVFLTAQTDIEYISRAFEVGGADYISKPFNGVELKARVKTQLQNRTYLEEVKNKQSKLAQLSITDPLTKLYNALYFDSQIKTYQKREENFWILYFTINNFDKVNNLYGFFHANRILRKFGALLQEKSYANAMVAKLYGVNFGVLTKDYSREDIKTLAGSIILGVMHDENLANIITVTHLLYNVKDPQISLPSIYKKMLDKSEELKIDSESSPFL